jgi:hypothetical protein
VQLVIDPLLAHRLQLQLDDGMFPVPVRLRADAQLDALRVEGREAENQRISFQRGNLQNIAVNLGEHVVELDNVAVEGAITLRDLRTEMDMQTDAVSARGVRYRSELFELSVEEAKLSGGVDLKASRKVQVPNLVARNARLVVPDILALFGLGWLREDAAARASDDDVPKPEAPPSKLSLGGFEFLDSLNGHVNVDVDVDVDVPVIGTREATHHYRTPIKDGTVSIEKLEDDLAGLEDAVIDFEVENGQLILEKDLPLIPWDNTTLISWDLDPEELAMAERDRVRLRTLLKYDLHLGDGKGGGGGATAGVVIRKIAARNLDVVLSMTTPSVIALGDIGTIRIGTEDRHGLVGLTASGEGHFKPNEEMAPTAIQAGIEEVLLGFEALKIAMLQMDADAIQLEHIHDVEISMEGYLPRRLEATVDVFTATNLELTLPRL